MARRGAAALGVVLMIAAATGAMGAERLAERLAALGGEQCAGSKLTCVAFEVPVDHDTGRTSAMTVHFAVSIAARASRGVLFYAVGGPGFSGIAAAGYLDDFDERLRNDLDVVFFDQRGVGLSDGLSCVDAQTAFDTDPAAADDFEAARAAAQRFAAACVAALPEDAPLAYLDTGQVVRDLEAFRQAIGVPKIWLYGESYGTQVAQQYATAFPAAVAGVVLDGDVDLTLTLEAFYEAYTEGAEAILARVLAACADISGCRQDMPDAGATLDGLLARLADGPIPVRLPLGDGAAETRLLTAGLVDAAVFYSLYTPRDRANLLRALAAAGRGSLIPLLRLAYADLGIDTETGIETEDGSWFGAAYYAVTCGDYGPEPGAADAEAQAAAIVAEARAFAVRAPRLLRDYYVERLVCAYWPAHGPEARPAPFAGGDYMTIVLTADADPITPASMARAIHAGARNSYLVSMAGGPHVIFGRGLACPDEIVLQAMIEGRRPEAREQACGQELVGPYTPLTLTAPAAMADAFAVAQAIETELDQSPEIGNWDAADRLAVGCDAGGSFSVEVEGEDDVYRFAGCAFWPGLVLGGTAVRSWNEGRQTGLRLAVTVSGSHAGTLDYRHSKLTEAASLAGTYDGRPAELPK